MAGTIINVKLSGKDKIIKRLERLEKAGRTISKPMKEAVIIGYRNIIQHFRKEEGPNGKWKPLKHRKGKILQDTGRLRMSINFRGSGNTGYLGTNVIYAATHQFGRGKIPARPFLWFSDETKQRIKKRFFNYVVK